MSAHSRATLTAIGLSAANDLMVRMHASSHSRQHKGQSLVDALAAIEAIASPQAIIQIWQASMASSWVVMILDWEGVAMAGCSNAVAVPAPSAPWAALACRLLRPSHAGQRATTAQFGVRIAPARAAPAAFCNQRRAAVQNASGNQPPRGFLHGDLRGRPRGNPWKVTTN